MAYEPVFVPQGSCFSDTAGESPFIQIADRIGHLVAEKNKAYGNSFRKSEAVLEQLYPDGVRPDQYQDMLCIIRIIDKLFRIATHKDAMGESPYMDIAGYGILGAARDEGSPA